MEPKQNISDCRKALDKALASQRLASKESIRKLVLNQRHSSPSDDQEKRVAEVSNLVDALRSASGDDSKACGWKIKQDTDVHRVMYREGLQGSPFHTLLAEISVDAPIDVHLCAAWEVPLYKTWWPQISFPTFKCTTACCLKKVRIVEQVGLLRMKLPWPISDREFLLDYFEIELLEDGLVIVLLNSISDTERVEKIMQEIAEDELPKAKDVVRMDLTGGFAIKKITSHISFSRTVGNLDLKMDFTPPSIINFISRQLLGDACKLFRKTAISVAKGDKDYQKALDGSLYVRLREHLYLKSKNNLGSNDLLNEDSENHDARFVAPI